MKATIHYRLHNDGMFNLKTWIATCTEGSFQLTRESYSYEGWKRILKEGQKCEIEIIRDYGSDPYDNQIYGIDYYDAAKITKYPDKKLNKQNIKLNEKHGN